ncbi:MAG: hypothetical protein ACLQGP_21970 [Isosphaeraceae bacterium]
MDPDEFATPVVKSWRSAFDATNELATAGAGLDLGGAPLASWVLARLAEISESSLFPADFVRREGELGGYRIRLLAVRATEPIAKLQLGAECGEAVLTATSSNPDTATEAARGLIVVLAAEPKSLGRCRVEVRARELGGHRNEYGYDGRKLLGVHNVH